MRSKLQYAIKDFVEKRITFAHDETIYCFFSSCPNGQDSATVDMFPPRDQVERAHTFYGAQKIYRSDNEGRAVVLESVVRADSKLPISNALLKTLVPSGVKDWCSKLLAHL